MMKRLIGVMLFVGVLLSSMAFATAEIVEVEVDEDTVSDGGSTILHTERGDELPVKVRVLALNDTEDVQIEVRLRGFDSSDTIDDITEVFDMKAGRTYIEKLYLPLRQKLDQDRYSLTVSIEGRSGAIESKTYDIEVETPEHDIEIRDVVLSPSNEVKAGRALLATVRVRNRGADDEEGVKVTVRVPELGISASDFIDELEREGDDDDEATSEELFLRIPDDAATGEYTVEIETVFDQGDKKNVKETTIFVLGKEDNGDNGNGEGSDDDGREKTVITVAADGQAASQDGGEVAYPITLTNAGSSSKTYMVSADGASWANFRVSPSNVMVVEAGESKAVTVFVSAKEDAPVGSQTFTVTVSTADKVLKQVPLTVVVEEAEGSSVANLKRGLEVGLVVLVILLVIIGLIIGFSKLRGDDEEDDDEDEEKTYY